MLTAATKANSMLSIVDDSGWIVWVNDAYGDHGWNKADVVGHHMFEFLHPDEIERTRSTVHWATTTLVPAATPAPLTWTCPEANRPAVTPTSR